MTEPMSARWRTEVLPPEQMTTEEIRAELRHDLNVYEQVGHQLSKAAMARRIEVLVEEMDARAGCVKEQP